MHFKISILVVLQCKIYYFMLYDSLYFSNLFFIGLNMALNIIIIFLKKYIKLNIFKICVYESKMTIKMNGWSRTHWHLLPVFDCNLWTMSSLWSIYTCVAPTLVRCSYLWYLNYLSCYAKVHEGIYRIESMLQQKQNLVQSFDWMKKTRNLKTLSIY